MTGRAGTSRLARRLSHAVERAGAKDTPQIAAPKKPGNSLQRHWNAAAAQFRAAPVLWTCALAIATKPLTYLYGHANHEALFLPLVISAAIENFLVALTDNKVRRYFTPQAPDSSIF